LEWLLRDGIADRELTPGHYEAPYPAATLQRSPRTCTNCLFHPLARITCGFNEEAYSPDTDALAKQFVQSDAAHDNLPTTGPQRYAGPKESPYFI